MFINLCMSCCLLSTVRTGVSCEIICALVIKITLIWGQLNTHSFPFLQQLPRLSSSLFFFLLSQKYFIFSTSSRNFHYIVVPLHGSCSKHASHQQIWAQVYHGEELYLQDYHPWVLFLEQNSLDLLSSLRGQRLVEEVWRGSSSACVSHAHHS